MDKNLSLTKTIKINAPIEEVWNALTDSEMTKEYMMDGNGEVISDWQLGSSILYRGEWQGKQFEDKGKITKLDENKELEFDYWSNMSGTEDKPENYQHINFKLQSEGDGTNLTLTQSGLESQEEVDKASNNWDVPLNKMKQMLEPKKLI